MRHYVVGDTAYSDENPVAVEHGTPVVVIDPEDDATLSRLWRLLPDNIVSIDQLQAALREFVNPKPEEPTGRYAVVEDSDGQEWCRIDVSNGYAWQKLGQAGTERHRYDMYRNIDAVKVLSPGVTE
jgi:hypothetical protein